MKVQVKSIKFRNFRSYGGILQEIIFKKGLTLINGVNGSGKSTILEVLSYNWFGQPYHSDILIKSLVNDITGKNLYTESEFDVDGNSYRLVRCMSPDSITLYRNDVVLELEHSKKLIQEHLNHILGINQYLFKNVIALAITGNVPFLTMDTANKRKTIDNVFGIKIFSDMTTEIKRELTKLKSDIGITDGNLNYVKKDYDGVNSSFNSWNLYISNAENRRNELEGMITTLSTKQCDGERILCEKLDAIEKLKEEYKLINLDEITKLHQSTNSKISESKYQIKTTSDMIAFFKNHSVCPTCGIELDDSFTIRKNNELSAELDTLVTEHAKASEIVKGIVNPVLSKADTITNSITELNNFVTAVRSKLYGINLEIEKARTELNALSSTPDMSAFTEQLKSKSQTISQLTDNVYALKRKQAVHNAAVDVLSDNGIRSYFLSRLTPMINSRVAYYLNVFDIPVRIVFDSQLEPTIQVLGRGRSYGNFSEGEKKRIDIAIYMAFIDATKMVSGWNCNLIILDEILDASLDAAGYENMLRCVRQIVDDGGMCGYVISHREEAIKSEFVTNSMSIVKNGEFSDIATQ